jgi:hypothetical protein
MKRKRSIGDLSTKPRVTEDKSNHVSVSAEHHINALRRGFSRSLTPLNPKLTCSVLSWSSQGTIAFVSPPSDVLSPSNRPGEVYGSTPRLYATTPSFDVARRDSILLEPLAAQVAPENVPIDHIVYNEAGIYLAVVDELGTITIWEQDSIASQLIPRHAFQPDLGTEELHQESANRVVSLRWLHNDQKIHVAVKLAKAGEQWNCQSNSQRGSGPCNSVGKEALVAITSGGTVL